MTDRLRRLERQLGLAPAPSPFHIDPKTVCRRVETTLSAEKTERKQYMKYRIRLAAALTAAALALTGTAFAAGPAINEALQRALGAFAPYAQAQEGVVEAEGIRVEVLSALADNLNAKVYLEVTDLTGDRLEMADIDGHLKVTLDGETTFTESCRIVDYDPETKTALVCVTRSFGVFSPDGLEGTVVLSDLHPEYHRFISEPLPVDNIPAQFLQTRQLSTGESVLVPDQNPLKLTEGDGAAISSMGFGDDGRLHFLTVFPQGALEMGHSILTVCSKTLDEHGSTLFKSGFQDVRFMEDGLVYYDFSCPATLADREVIDSLTGIYGVYTTAEALESRWELPVTLKQVESSSSPLSGLIDRNTLLELRLSPLGVTLVSSSPDHTQIGGYPLSVFLTDGTILPLTAGSYGHQGDGVNIAQWLFDLPEDIHNITGVALGCWMIPVQNGIAGEGCWLSALPQ